MLIPECISIPSSWTPAQDASPDKRAMSEGDFYYGEQRLENDLVVLEPFDVRLSAAWNIKLVLTWIASAPCSQVA
jgi:hypothetical protein